ncbi:diguanylate cyclase [Paraburkholderia guartelaensis]|uniref:diguanylate cyclase n=1 Tax=Paraburkholderia guartelaensis TaxID=2546446 RepID=UPI002AB77D4A|nr:diguanylate cyclase [Paraburkholderia guartelaensis]
MKQEQHARPPAVPGLWISASGVVQRLRMVRRFCVAAAGAALTPTGLLCCSVMLWLGTAEIGIVMLLASRADAYERAVQNAGNLTLVLERDIQRSIELYDLSLRAVAEGAADPQVMTLPPMVRHRVLFDQAATARYLGPVSVFDHNGRLLIRSDENPVRPTERGERNPLSIHSSLTNSGLAISRPYVSVAAGNTEVIALERHITRADGTSGGIVVGRLDIDYFRDLLDGLSIGPGGTVTVFETDGTLITRLPYDHATVGSNLARNPVFERVMMGTQGAFVGAASVDGIRRLHVYRRLPGLPIVVEAAPTMSEVFSEWRARARWFAIIMIVFTAIKATGTWMLIRALRQRQRAEAELRRFAQRDSLTGLDNRRTLDQIMSAEGDAGSALAKCSRCSSSTSIISRPTTTTTDIKRATRR